MVLLWNKKGLALDQSEAVCEHPKDVLILEPTRIELATLCLQSRCSPK